MDSLAAVSLSERDDQTEAPEIKAMKRDARWLQATNLQFEEIASRYKMIYFRELAGDIATSKDNVRAFPLVDCASNLFMLPRSTAKQ